MEKQLTEFERFDTAYEKLLKNREKIPLKDLETRYKKGYMKLVEELKSFALWFYYYMLEDFKVQCEGSPWNATLNRIVERVAKEELEPGGSFERACKALITDLNVPKFFKEISVAYQRIDDSAYKKYWVSHCRAYRTKRGILIYNFTTKKWWLPYFKTETTIFNEGCWVNSDFSDPSTERGVNEYPELQAMIRRSI
jgi:hypothetical protein